MAQHTPWHRLSIKVDDVGQTNGTEKKTGNAYIFLYGNPKERDHLLGLDICRRMALTFMSCLSIPWCLHLCCGYLCNPYTGVCGFTKHSAAGNIPNKLCL